MKYFKDSLFWVKFNNELQAIYDEEAAYVGLVAESKKNKNQSAAQEAISPWATWLNQNSQNNAIELIT